MLTIKTPEWRYWHNVKSTIEALEKCVKYVIDVALVFLL